MTLKLETLTAVTEGRLSVDEAARALQVSGDEVRRQLELLELADAMAARRVRTMAGRALRLGLGALLVLAVSGTLFITRDAWAAGAACPNGYPFCFLANTPAKAAEINTNFAQAKEWLEAKVGAVAAGAPSTSAITASSLSTTGTVSFGAQTRQMMNLFGSTYGIGVQNATYYERSAGGFAWYLNGTHANGAFDSGGGTELMRLESTGNLAVTTINNRRPAYTVFNTCNAATCTASCGAGVVKMAFGFHGMNGTTTATSTWGCGSALSWLGNCVGQSSCTVTTGCSSSSLFLECW